MTQTEDLTLEYVKARNTLSEIMNKLAPKVNEYFDSGKVCYKKDGSLYNKNATELRTIATDIIGREVERVRFLPRFDNYTRLISLDITCPTSMETCAYFEDYFYVSRDYTHRLYINVEDVIAWRKELTELESLLSDTRSRISTLKRHLNIR